MSTNTTSTNNGAGRPKGSKTGAHPQPGPGGAELRFPFATFPMPDAQTLERLANEFFLVVPSDMGNGDHESGVEFPEAGETESIPTTLLTEENLPRHGGEATEPPSSPPGSLPSSPPGPLTETDLRAIAASLAGATALVPGTPGTAPAPPAAGSPPDLGAGGKVSPFSVAPTLPSGNEVFSFPAMAAFPSTPPLSSPSGGDLATLPQTPGRAKIVPGQIPEFSEGESGKSPQAAPWLPPVNDLFSFPRVPAIPNAAGLGATVNPPAPPLSRPPLTSLAPPASDGRGVAGGGEMLPPPPPISVSPQGHEASIPHFPADAGVSYPAGKLPTPSASAGDSDSAAGTQTAAYPGAISSLPSGSELFSFPGVPGAQSPPGIPVFPTSITGPAALEAPRVPGAPSPALSLASLPAVSAPPPSAPPAPGQSSQPFEFQPDVVPDLGVAKRPLDARLLRRDFPILDERVHGRPLIWLDNAATTQKPNAVIDRIAYFYRHENSNIHRAAHTLAARATDAYESAREKTRRFLNASTTKEIIFVRGTTEAINLIAQSWGRRNVRPDDEIVITWLEHHANIVPWQQLCSEKGARLRVAPVNDRGEVILEEYEKLLGPRTRLVSFSQVSNALGTITPAREMVAMAHRHGACVLVDGAQAVSHMPVDVQTLNCDFYVFSGHKVFGPTGIGAVYGKLDVLEHMPPWQGGGNMIVDVTFEKTVYQGPPARFEAGTGNIADAVGLGAALDYVEQIGLDSIAAYEHDLLVYGTEKLLTVPGLRLIGTARDKAGVLSFVLDDVRTEDVGVALNQEGIAVRSGHHCAQPILRRMGVESTVRPSLAFYNTCEELDHLVAALLRIQAGRGHRSGHSAG
jgi:cysteine desulfurase / selenocysteine lyase